MARIGSVGRVIAGAAVFCLPVGVAAQDRKAGFGEVRVSIDPGLGEQESQIRQMLAAYPFVRTDGPADYLVTTAPDFPLDLSLVDVRRPPALWHTIGEDNLPITPEPPRHYIGNLASEDTADRLGHFVIAAARVRALLDRSLVDLDGIEACLEIKDQRSAAQPVCHSLNDRQPTIVGADSVGMLKVTNRSDSDRYVGLISVDGDLSMASLERDGDPPVRKLAPGESFDFLPLAAVMESPDDPRVILLSSRQPIAIDGLLQGSPLSRKFCFDRPSSPCAPGSLPISGPSDLAVRSFQLDVPDEPQPMMGHGTDVTAQMAVWMAQFYSIRPYSADDIAKDAKLPGEETQFLALRTYEERQHRCGATVVGPNLVLTAAHCVAKGQYAGDGLSKMLADRRVRLGSRQLGKGGESYAIAGVAVHGLYDPDRTNHDLALLLLQPDRGSGKSRQQPIAVADRPLPGAAKSLAFGWGFTGAVAPSGNIMMAMDSRVQSNPDVLQYGEMTSVTLDQCRRKLANLVAPGMVCMYSPTALSGGQSRDGVFTCRGDSGGPLVRKVNGRDMLVGVVSWSKGCGFKDFPSVFTDVGSYARWISAARAALKPGMAIRVDDPARPPTGTRRN